MDAPQGRYRVVEKDGRLVVIDNATGAPVSSSVPPPPRPGGPGASSAPLIAEGKGAVDSLADALLALAVHEWDAEGRAVIRWKWKQNGKERRWDAWLDLGQQRRLGRALLGLGALPLLILISIFASGLLMWLGILFTLPFIFRGFHMITRLQSETAGQKVPDG